MTKFENKTIRTITDDQWFEMKFDGTEIEKDAKCKPIYRIFPYHRIIEVLATKRLTLVDYNKWDDPFENFIHKCQEYFKNQYKLEDWRAYGQSWSKKEESDCMWRIYSTDKLGVKVKTTPESLIDMLVFEKENYRNKHPVFPLVGLVNYKKKEEILIYIENCKSRFSQYPKSHQFDLTIIIPFFTKRDVFRHEEEARIIYCTDLAQNKDLIENKDEGIVQFKIDPNKVFEEIILDPRLEDKRVNDIKDVLKELGFQNKIEKSSLYEAPKFV